MTSTKNPDVSTQEPGAGIEITPPAEEISQKDAPEQHSRLPYEFISTVAIRDNSNYYIKEANKGKYFIIKARRNLLAKLIPYDERKPDELTAEHWMKLALVQDISLMDLKEKLSLVGDISTKDLKLLIQLYNGEWKKSDK